MIKNPLSMENLQPDRIIERASAFHPEWILMDINMPDYSGEELATVIRQHDK